MSSERKTPLTPPTVATANSAGYDAPGAARPNPTLAAEATAALDAAGGAAWRPGPAAVSYKHLTLPTKASA